jgi:subtilisin family serine protease
MPSFEASAEIAAGLRIEIEETAQRAFMRGVRTDPTVVGVAPAMSLRLVEPVVEAQSLPGEEGGTTWGVDAVGAPASPFDGSGVVVAVLDTGIDPQHEAFTAMDLEQRDFTGIGNGDQHGHGTHCAGTIFGRALKGLRIGVAPGVTHALIGKVLGGPFGGGTDVLASAMLWAYQGGANVICMSLGIDFPGFVERLVQENGLPIPQATSIALDAYSANVRLFEQLADLFNAGARFTQSTLMVAAAGNESGRDKNPAFEVNVGPPAAAPGIVAVAALGPSPEGLVVAPFSNTRVTIAAPGVNVISARPGGGTCAFSGTIDFCIKNATI